MALEIKRIHGDRWSSPIVVMVKSRFLEPKDPDLVWCVDPPFQRGSVWTLRQKRAWIESLLTNYPLPAIFINSFGMKPGSPAHPVYGIKDIVIDGQQRIRAIADFLQDKFQVRGEYYSDQDEVFKRVFDLDPVCPIINTYFKTMKECAELYVKLLTAGTAHTSDEIQNARKYLQECSE